MRIFSLLSLLLYSSLLLAQLQLPPFLSSGMVLQQQKANRIWGWAKPDQRVELQFLGKTYPTFADQEGAWQVFLDAAKAGTGGDMVITAGEEKRVLTDILIGEVWICSGQSNMEWQMSWLGNAYKAELDTANNPQIRFVTIRKSLAARPRQTVALDRPWSSIDTASIGQCSAVAYFFGKKLQQELKVPIGLVVSSWGGTFAQSWTSFEGLHDFPHYEETFSRYIRPLDLDSVDVINHNIRTRFNRSIQENAAFVHQAIQPAFDDQLWPEMYLPKEWEEQGFPTMDGTVLYRIRFQLNAVDAGKAANLQLPPIDDQDSTFINGQFIGSTYQWDALRSYSIPPGILKRGINVLSIYVRDDGGGGGLSPRTDHFYLQIGTKSVSLAGKAKFKILARLEDITGGQGEIVHQPAVLYNAMISPLLPLTIRGAIWYQGESNAGRAWEYRRLFPAMIMDWRNHWGQADFPFLFVQLSSFGPIDESPPVHSNWAELRDAQTGALGLPNTAMAVTIDQGDPADIHPKHKKEVGDRLADQALRMVYNTKEGISSGPRFKRFTRSRDTILLEFSDVGSGLTMKGPALKSFALAGPDQSFVWADAQLMGDRVAVWSERVPNPVALRYAWADSPIEANLFNQEGYPALPFQIELHSFNNPVVAHRGAWKKQGLPENSIASLKNAIALGCAGSEFDVRMTADDSLIIHHDPKVQGLSIETTVFKDLRAFRLSNGEKLPTLREYIQAGMQDNPGTRLVCEIKPSETSKERGKQIAAQTVRLFQEMKAEKKVVYISFDYDILMKILELDPDANTQYLEGDKSPEQLRMDNVKGADFHASVYQEHPGWIEQAQEHNLVLNVWTVNEIPEMLHFLNSGFHLITTNEPESLLEIYSKK